MAIAEPHSHGYPALFSASAVTGYPRLFVALVKHCEWVNRHPYKKTPMRKMKHFVAMINTSRRKRLFWIRVPKGESMLVGEAQGQGLEQEAGRSRS